jgi:uncharacterized cupredoxin-like copper-binding protein
VTALAFAGTDGFGMWGSTMHRSSCAVPALPGTVVQVRLTNMGGGMMGGGMMGGGNMRVSADTASVPRGSVTFVARNNGSITHELVVLPLANGQQAGDRTIQGDGAVNEDASLGEASNACGASEGDGIPPGSASWVTLDLQPGRYELVCNISGHYAAGMHTQLTVD